MDKIGEQMSRKEDHGILETIITPLVGVFAIGAVSYIASDYIPFHRFEYFAKTNNIPDYPGEAEDIKNLVRINFLVLGGMVGGMVYDIIKNKNRN